MLSDSASDTNTRDASCASSVVTLQSVFTHFIAKTSDELRGQTTLALMLKDFVGMEPNEFILNLICSQSLVEMRILDTSCAVALPSQDLFSHLFETHPLVRFAGQKYPVVTLNYFLLSLKLSAADLALIDCILHDKIPIASDVVGSESTTQIEIIRDRFRFLKDESHETGAVANKQQQFDFFVDFWMGRFHNNRSMERFMSDVISVFVNLELSTLHVSPQGRPPCVQFSQAVMQIIEMFLHDVLYTYRQEYEIRAAMMMSVAEEESNA